MFRIPFDDELYAWKAALDRERWEIECRALGATPEQCAAFDAAAWAYAPTTPYPNSGMVAICRRLAIEALLRRESWPTDPAALLAAEKARRMAALLGE